MKMKIPKVVKKTKRQLILRSQITMRLDQPMNDVQMLLKWMVQEMIQLKSPCMNHVHMQMPRQLRRNYLVVKPLLSTWDQSMKIQVSVF